MQGGLRSEGGDGARGRPLPPVYGRPQAQAATEYKGTLKIRAEDGGKVRVSVIVVPSAGLMFSRDKAVWVTLPSESKSGLRKHSRAYAPPGEDASGLWRPAARSRL